MIERTPTTRGMRIRPSVWVGIAAWFLYSGIAAAIQLQAGIPYSEWFRTGDSALRTAVIPLAVGSVLLLAFVLWSRWDHVWSDPIRLKTTGIMKLSMVAWVAMVALRLIGVTWGSVPPALLLAIVASGVGVGFAEELLFRGIFLRSLREGGRSEAVAAIWTGVCFGLFHIINVFMGMGWLGLIQVVLAALSGILLYAFRRHYSLLWPAMIAHGMWDISTFVAGGYATPWLKNISTAAQGVFVVLGILVYVSIYRNDRQTVVIPVADAS